MGLTKMISQDYKIWIGSFIRAVVIMGLVFFSISLTYQQLDLQFLLSAGLTGGLYLFIELARYYGININQYTSKQKENQKKLYSFLLFT